MDLEPGMFAIKLYELGQAYEKLQNRLILCQKEDPEKIRRELQMLTEECAENDMLLQSRVSSSRLPMVSELADAQLSYSRRVKHILTQNLWGRSKANS